MATKDLYPANEYDQAKSRYQWYAPEVMFGFLYEFISPGQKLLDIGIGTGLSSELFYKAGLLVSGLDNNSEMLEVCRKKQIAEMLVVHDVDQSWPYEVNAFDHLISCGVFHFFSDLEHFLKEAARVLKPKGFFAFTVSHLDSDMPEFSTHETSHAGLFLYKHSNPYVETLYRKYKFDLIKSMKFIVLDENEQDLAMQMFLIRLL